MWIYCTTVVENDIYHCCVEFSYLYKPQQRDKFSNRYTQKGIIVSIIPEELITHTEF